MSSSPLAICISDTHWSHTAPSARVDEPDWYEAMDRQLVRLRDAWDDLDQPHILIAGDLFDRWNPPISLVTFIAERLKAYFRGKERILAIPGQHDLPNHNLFRIKESAYYALTEMGAIHDISGRSALRLPLVADGYPWNVPAGECEIQTGGVHVALAHRYAYSTKKQAYAGIEEPTWKSHGFSGYDWVHYGDNHIRWCSGGAINPGTFMTRFKNDIGQDCGGYVIYSKTRVEPLVLPTDGDVITIPDSPTGSQGPSADEVMSRLNALTADGLDVRGMVRKQLSLSESSEVVKALILKLMDDCQT